MKPKRRIKKSIRPRRKVEKMLSPEEMTLVSNIGSILEQLMQMGQGGGEEVAPQAVMESEDSLPPMDEEKEDGIEDTKKARKGLEETPSDSSTASDDAEERMEEVIPEQTTENVDEVAKAMRILLGYVNKQNVKKSVKKQESPLTQVLNKMVEVQKSSQNQIDELATAMTHVLEGLGVTKQLEVVQQSHREPKKINKSQNDELIEVFKSITGNVGKSEISSEMSQHNAVRKNLANADVLKGLLGR